MPGRKPGIPQLCHHRAAGQAVVVLGGKWHCLGKFGTPEAEERYNRVIASWLTGGRQSPLAADLTINELILAYWRYPASSPQAVHPCEGVAGACSCGAVDRDIRVAVRRRCQRYVVP